MPAAKTNLQSPSQFIDLARGLNALPPKIKVWPDIQIHSYRLDTGQWSHGPITDLRLSIQLDGRVKIKLRLHSCWQEDIRGPSQISLTPPGETASWAWQSYQETALLFISGTLLNELSEDAYVVSGSIRFRTPLAENDPLLDQFANLLLAHKESEEPVQRLWLDSAARFLGMHILRRYSESSLTFRKGGLTGAQIKRITDFIRDNLAEEITLPALASLAGVSRAHFCSAFKMSLGITPHQYVMECRLKGAQETMRSTPTSLASIAAGYGFSSEQHFCSAFKRKFGATPGAWRKQVKE